MWLLCIFVADYLQSSEILFDPNFTKYLWVKIKLDSNEYLIIGTIYTVVPHLIILDLCDLMKLVCDTKPAHLLIIGYFKYPSINWNGDYYEQLFAVNGIHQCSLHQLFSSHSIMSNRLLDLVNQ